MDEKKINAEAEKTAKKAEKAKKKMQKERAKKEKYDIGSGGTSKAEEAREKRKANVAKAEEKAKAKKPLTKKQKRLRIILPIVVIVLALGIFFMNYFGVFNRAKTAVKLEDGSRISVAETEYYYRSMYNYYYSMSQQYDSYYGAYYGEGAGASMTGFDCKKTPAEQDAPATDDYKVKDEYKKNKDGNATWDDFFTQSACETAQLYEGLYTKAEEAGYKMSDADIKEMDEFLDSLRETAESSEYSLDAYLRNTYGKGMTKGLLKKIYTKQTVASKYMDDKEADFASKVTDNDITNYLKKNKNNYYTVDVRFYNFSTEVSEKDSKDQIKKKNAETKAKAEKFLAQANSGNWTNLVYQNVEEAYKEHYKDNADYSTLKAATSETLGSYFNEDAVKWIYAAKVGDKKMFEQIADETGAATYACVLLTKAPSLEDVYPVSVRHILVMAKDPDDEDSQAKHTDAEAKALADKYLAEWKDGKMTDATFEALCKKYSEDTGVSENSGLYEDIKPTDSYVQEFLDWAFTDGRKAGDVGIIKSEYGYHVMYCVKVSKEPSWKTDVRDAVGAERYNKYYEDQAADKAYAIKKTHHLNAIRKTENKFAKTCISNAIANSSAAY